MLTRRQLKKKREEKEIVGTKIVNGTISDSTPIAKQP